MVKRGHIYRHARLGMRFVVLSSDDWNATSYTASVLAAPITHSSTDMAGVEIPYLVNLNDADSVSGFVRIAEASQVLASDLVQPDRDEMLSGASLSNIKTMWDEFLGY
ncbi:hypothetical protein [Haloglycomyces albus]|uniref:hypothetical protein n=1 Tax=Haloglycomyces albus TaxID=526067 RepID=UPI00046D1789|nr:hypothetical protein [Haloglycomyces albus]